MPKTKNDLAARALSLLGALPSGQSPSAQDMALTLSMIAPVFSELKARRVVEVDGNSDEIDDSLFLPLSYVLASALSADFGVVGEELAMLESNAARAEMRMREMQIAFDSSDTIKIAAF